MGFVAPKTPKLAAIWRLTVTPRRMRMAHRDAEQRLETGGRCGGGEHCLDARDAGEAWHS